MKIYDIIILGCGGVGSATLYSSAKAGFKTLGIEQYHFGHTHGGTHGESRAFRMAYYDNPQYIPLLKKAYQSWKKFEKLSKKKLLVENGVLEIGLEKSKMFQDASICAREHDIPIEILTKDQILSRFKGFHIPDRMKGILQPYAGFLYVDECMKSFIESAKNYGAQVKFSEKVISWFVDSNQLVHVHTNQGSYCSKNLIITTGAWTPELLASLNLPIKIIQKKLVWAAVYDGYAIDNSSPCFAYHLKNGIFYGFPAISNRIKVARHSNGTILPSPNHKNSVDSEEFLSIKQFIQDYLPQANINEINQENCLYDLTSDHQFIVDLHPFFQQVAFATGFSGHGYKMSNIIGDILVELVTKKNTEFDISFLSLNRF
ncbi:MAG: N-methyl-L-tryptophan oxidase [bacterium]|nr:N-methyl-L-tryptophan oxidase [bacterium]